MILKFPCDKIRNNFKIHPCNAVKVLNNKSSALNIILESNNLSYSSK